MALYLWTDRLDIPVPDVTTVYPLPDWPTEPIDRLTVDLSMIDPMIGMTLTPSISIPGQSYGAQFHINDTELIGIGENDSLAGDSANEDTDPYLSQHLDYVEIIGVVDDGLTLSLDVTGDKNSDDPVIAMAVGDTNIPMSDDMDDINGRAVPPLSIPPISQMQDGVSNVRDRLCCPACVAMVMRYYGVDTDLAAIADDCYRSSVDLYGVWPQAVYAANQRGLSGYCHRFENLAQLSDLLSRGIPVICSIAYQSGQLNGAAINQTEGHLIILAGMDGGCVTAYDPAAKTDDGVYRTYTQDEFCTGWFNHGGLGIVIFE